MVSGIDARLIEAEAKLNANDIAGMMTILNALRAAPPKIGNYQPAVDGGAADAGDAGRRDRRCSSARRRSGRSVAVSA